MKEITLKLTLEDANLILEGLGEMPFNKVFKLIGTIQQQAANQLDGNGIKDVKTPIEKSE